ncbi:MAG: hypothetical protein QXO69_02295 [archaeon]
MSEMHKKMFILLVASIVTFSAGFIAMSSAQLPEWLLVFPLNTTPLMMTLIVFTFGFLLFGYPSPVITLLSGLHSGWLYSSGINVITVAAMSACTLMAAFSSAYMGTSLLEDLSERGNFKQSIKMSISVLAAAFIIALISDFIVVT